MRIHATAGNAKIKWLKSSSTPLNKFLLNNLDLGPFRHPSMQPQGILDNSKSRDGYD